MEELEDLQVSILAIAYHLYRQAGMPYGDNISGLTMWLDMQKQSLEKIVDADGRD